MTEGAVGREDKTAADVETEPEGLLAAWADRANSTGTDESEQACRDAKVRSYRRRRNYALNTASETDPARED